MQNRLDGAAEAQAASEKQLAELHSAIAAERAARPESVSNLSSAFRPSAATQPLYLILLLFSPLVDCTVGPTQRGTWSIGFC